MDSLKSFIEKKRGSEDAKKTQTEEKIPEQPLKEATGSEVRKVDICLE